MRSLNQILTAGVILVSAGGCVSSGKYHKLEREQQEANQRIQLLESQLGSTSVAKTKLESSVAEKDQALADLQKRKAEAEKRIAEFRELTSKFQKLVDAGKLSVKIVNGRMTVALSADVLFASGSAKLSSDGSKAIKETAALLSTLSGRKFQVEGHTDNLPISTASFPSNWELAAARALTVLKTMVDAGLAPENISAASFGDTQPVKSNDTPEERGANRRIAIVIVPDLSSLPGFEELQKVQSQR